MKDLLTRVEAEPVSEYGKKPQERTVEELLDFGAVIIDKPSGPTSHQVSAYVQEILGISKSGHSGTLDPKVTGVLPIGLNRATRLMQYLLASGKKYVGIMHVHDDIAEYELRKVAQQFIGTITQLPPKRSSVARRNRQRNIYSFRFIEIRGRDILFEADVQAGTYIRKLCSDYGEKIGSGAHMAELRRTRVANILEEQSISLQQLSDIYSQAKQGNEEQLRKHVIPAEELVSFLPQVIVLDSAVHSITNGATLKVPGIQAVQKNIEVGDTVRIMTKKGEMVAIGEAEMTSEQMMGERGLAIRTEKVFLPSEVYPNMTLTNT